MRVITSFSLFNLLIAFGLYFLEIVLWNIILVSVIFFFIIFLKISYFTKIANNKKIDTLISAFGLNIGVKFLASLVFIFILYYKQYFIGTTPIIIFMFYYFAYTFLIARFGVNRLV